MPAVRRRPFALAAALLPLAACTHRAVTPQAVRTSELSWRACPSSQATEVENGAQEAIRVYAGEAYTGSPNAQPVAWLTTIRAGFRDVVATIQPTANYLWVAAVDRPFEPNGSIRRPTGYAQIRVRCVPRE